MSSLRKALLLVAFSLLTSAPGWTVAGDGPFFLTQ